MAHQSELIEKDILAYLKSQEEKSLLRFITCGSVDDGKSTLIGRLLWDSKMVFEDQLAALEADSKKVGTQGGAIDYALLMDGLQAEREQGITIDVAYRYFSTDKRKFIVADTPGHEQYTRNMVTGASTAQVAVILVDARKGLLTQTRRHSFLVSLVGIRNVVLAVNKMDLVNFNAERFNEIVHDYRQFAESLGFASITAIPLSALNGDNMIEASANTPTIRPGDELQVAASGRTSRVARIVTMDGDLKEATAGQAVTLTLTDEVDISRGDVLAATDAPPRLSRHPEAHLVWLHDEALQPGKIYLVKTATAVTPGRVTRVQFAVDVNTLEQKQLPTLGLNEIGVVRLELDRPAAFDPYRQNRETGSFILIDRFSNATVAAGMVIAVAPLESQNAQLTEFDAASSEASGSHPRRISLSEFSISGTGVGMADLTEEWGSIEFEVSTSFLDYLGKGNRILFRLRDVRQLEPVALMAYEHNLNFEFGRVKDRVNVILYKHVAEPVQQELEGLGL